MARTRGSRNADYEQQRAAIVRSVSRALESADPPTSLRALAEAAGVSVATMRHYFTDRTGVLSAVLEGTRAEAAPYLAMASRPVLGDVRASLLHFLGSVHRAWFRYGVGARYASTLAIGLSSPSLGPGFVNHVLEPLLQTQESLLRQHVERGELRLDDVRHAALLLLGPVVLALLHQDSLGGAGCRPLELPGFLEQQVDLFLRLYAPGAPGARRRAPR